MKVSDGATSQSVSIPVKKDVINKLKIAKSKSNIALFAYPTIDSDAIHINNANDKVFLYLAESK